MLRVLHTRWTISLAIFLFRHLQSQVLSQGQVWYLYFSYIYPFSANYFKKYHLYSFIKNISWLTESSTPCHVQHTTIVSTPIIFVLKDSQPREQDHSIEMYYEFWVVTERERENKKMTQSKPNVWSPLKISIFLTSYTLENMPVWKGLDWNTTGLKNASKRWRGLKQTCGVYFSVGHQSPFLLFTTLVSQMLLFWSHLIRSTP